MTKSTRIDSLFSRERVVMKMKKMHPRLSKIEKLYENPKLRENKKQLSKVPKITYKEFENALESDHVFQFGNTYKVTLF